MFVLRPGDRARHRHDVREAGRHRLPLLLLLLPQATAPSPPGRPPLQVDPCARAEARRRPLVRPEGPGGPDDRESRSWSPRPAAREGRRGGYRTVPGRGSPRARAERSTGRADGVGAREEAATPPQARRGREVRVTVTFHALRVERNR